MSDSGKLKLEGTGESCSSLISYRSWLHSHPNLKSKSHGSHNFNTEPLYQLVCEINESNVLVEGQKARSLIDSGSQLSSISLAWVKKLKLNTWQLHSVLQIEGFRGL